MSQLSIIAFLAFLSAFNVNPATIKTVSDILYASQASTTQVTATTTLQVTPIGDTTLSTQSTQQPVFGGTIQTNQPIQMPEDKSAITVNVEQQRLDTHTKQQWFAMTIRVLDANGKTTPIPYGNAPSQKVTITSDDGVNGETWINGRVDRESTDWFGSWAYYPTSIGDHTLTFTSGNLTKQVTINVQ